MSRLCGRFKFRKYLFSPLVIRHRLDSTTCGTETSAVTFILVRFHDSAFLESWRRLASSDIATNPGGCGYDQCISSDFRVVCRVVYSGVC